MIAIEIENLSKNYGRIVALNNMSLNVPKGSIYGLVGPNGSGKTTLIKALIGSLRPNSGSVKVLGLDPLKDKWQLRKQIGYMPQSPALYDDLSARDNIRFFGEAQNVSDLEQKVDEILLFAELTARADDLVRTFSGGMKKRVSLCCSLIHSPQIIFLDEPTAAVDPHLKMQSWMLFRKLAQSGVTIFISTHQMDEVLLCDQVTILRNGEILAVDTPQNILKRGKTRIKTTIKNEDRITVIDSNSTDLANALKIYGLDNNISSVEFQPDSIEDIILTIVREKEKEGKL